MKYLGSITDPKDLVTKEYVDNVSDMIADEYSSSSTYSVGDYCIYNGDLYRCIIAITIPEVWNSLHWVQVQLGDDVSDLKNALDVTDFNFNDYASYVDYGYHTAFDQSEAESGTWQQKIGIFRVKDCIVLNKHTDLGYASNTVRVKVSGNVAFAINNSGIDAWTSGITLATGHKYAVIVKKLGGSSTYQPSGEEAIDEPPPAYVYIAGGHTDKSGEQERESDVVRRFFTAEANTTYNIALVFNAGDWMFDNAKLLVILEDCTESERYNVEQSVSENQAQIAYLDTMTEHLAQRIGLDANIGNLFTFTDNGRINYVTGAIQTGSTYSRASYSNAVKISAYDKLSITMPLYNVSSASGLAFYDENDTFVSGVAIDYDTELDEHVPYLREIAVPETAEYVRLTWFVSSNVHYSEFSCVGVISGAIIDENVLPDYYFADNYLDGRVDTINETTKAMGMRNDTFFFFSDSHFYRMTNDSIENGMHGIALMQYIADRTNVREIVCGGDLTNGKGIANGVCVKYLGKVLQYLSPLWDKIHMIYGNHEWNNPSNSYDPADTAEELNVTQIYNLLEKDKEREYGALDIGNTASISYGTYWIDDPVQKIRKFYLPCSVGARLVEHQLLWIADQFANIPDGYALIVISHIGIEYEKINDAYTGNIIYTGRFDEIAKMLDALKTKTTYTYVRPNDPDFTRTFDYSNTNVTPVGAFTGHTHFDMSITTTEGVPIIGITCDRGPTPTSSSAFVSARKYGTIKEQAIDCVQVDMDNRKIYTTRIGGSYAYDSATQQFGPMDNPDREFSF